MAQNKEEEKFFQSSRGYITSKQSFCEVEKEVSYESDKNKAHFYALLACVFLTIWIVLLTVATIVLGCWYLKLQKEVDSQGILLKTCLKDHARLRDLKVDDIKDTEKEDNQNGEAQINIHEQSHVKFGYEVSTQERHTFQDNSVYTLSRQKRADQGRNNRRHNQRGNKNRNKKPKKNKKKKPGSGKKKREQQIVAYHLHSQSTTTFEANDKKYKNWLPDQDILQSSPSSRETYQYGDGDITILQTGVYFIYSQVTYLTQYPTVSHSVQKLDSKGNESTLMKCINAVELTQTNAESATARYCHCYVAKAVYLKENEKIFIRDDHGAHNSNEVRVVDFAAGKTYWGFIKL